MRIARVFPRRTNATPKDDLAFIGPPPECFSQSHLWSKAPEVDEVHISVTFTCDTPKAEKLAREWAWIAPVKIGGPAFNEPGGDFVPGKYLKEGYVITSRGCPNRCWFCSVPAREGYQLRQLPITHGWNVLDDNLLACSESHIRAVFRMLADQPHKPLFTGGLEAKMLKPWHAEELRKLGAKRLYMAYDTPDDLEPLIEAGKMLREGGITQESHTAACYVLVGYQGDTFEKAEKRLTDTVKAGFWPNAMLYRDDSGNANPEWRRFQREWFNPHIVGTKVKTIAGR
ncbi:MAG: hypothetical protein ACK5LX_00985 [Oscillospiraceae bacterium]